MRLLADEGVDARIVSRLRADGHDVTYIAETAPGSTDDAVLALASDESRVLIAIDKDFGELVFRQRRALNGVVLVRLAGLAPEPKASLVAATIRDHEAELTGAFTVISHRTVRIRH